jgi:hypothetical protein
MEYPLTACESCVHNNVCKFIDEINKMKKKNKTPLNFGSATCDEYLPDADYELEKSVLGENPLEEFSSTYEPNEVNAESILDNISESCEHLPLDFSGSIIFSSMTLNLIEKYVGKPMFGDHMEMAAFAFGDVRLAIKVDDRLKFGEFAIIGLINDNDDNMRTF